MSDGPRTAGRPRGGSSDRSVEYARKREAYAKLRRRCRCTWCKVPTRGTALCPACRKVSRERQRRMRDARVAADQCRECGAPANGQARCEACNQIRNLRPSRQPGQSGWKSGGAK